MKTPVSILVARRQVGPSLYWSMQEPKVGDTFDSNGRAQRVVDVTPDLAVSGGYLFTTEDANGPANPEAA